MALRAVVFDYGMVLTGPQDAESHAALMRLTGLPLAQFEQVYWADRLAYDEGKLSGLEFWQKLLRDAKLDLPPGTDRQLKEWDARMWSTVNPAMVAWQQQLKRAGLKTAILSNMGDAVMESIEREFAWIHGFDVLVWSYQLGIAKPDPEIYRHVMAKLGTKPEETLFLDDKRINIEAALALGMKAIEFSTVEQLRLDLVSAGLDGALPLPA